MIQPGSQARTPSAVPTTGAWTNVLVPLDGSAASHGTLMRARRVLEGPRTAVTLLRVVECAPAQAKDPAFRADARHNKARAALRESLGRMADPYRSARAQVRFGDPVAEILAEISDARHDLVVMTTRGRTPDRDSPDRVAERILLASPVPLLLLPPAPKTGGASPASAVLKRLLVMLDGLEAAGEILPLAEQVAKTYGSELHLFGAIFAGSRGATRRREAGTYLRECAASLAERGIVSTAHVCTGPVLEEALALIRKRAIDSVALMVHERSGLAHAVHGSMAQQLIRESGVPVLVLRPRRNGQPSPPGPVSRGQLWVE